MNCFAFSCSTINVVCMRFSGLRKILSESKMFLLFAVGINKLNVLILHLQVKLKHGDIHVTTTFVFSLRFYLRLFFISLSSGVTWKSENKIEKIKFIRSSSNTSLSKFVKNQLGIKVDNYSRSFYYTSVYFKINYVSFFINRKYNTFERSARYRSKEVTIQYKHFDRRSSFRAI